MLKSVQKIMETPDLDKMIREKILTKRVTKTGTITQVPVADLVAGISPSDPNKVVVGFSLCHKNKDRYDYIDKGRIRVPGFGKKLAIARAIKWENEKDVQIPDSLQRDMYGFLKRCTRYYKDKNVGENISFDDEFMEMAEAKLLKEKE